MRRCGFCSFDDIPRARAEAAEGDVSLDRIVEERDVLADDRHVVAQRGERHVSDILAVDEDLPSVTSKSRGTRLMTVDLPAPERPTSATVDPPAISRVKSCTARSADACRTRTPRGGTEMAPSKLKLFGDGLIGNRRLFIDQAIETFGRCDALLKAAGEISERPNRLRRHQQRRYETHEIADGRNAVRNAKVSEADDARDSQAA